MRATEDDVDSFGFQVDPAKEEVRSISPLRFDPFSDTEHMSKGANSGPPSPPTKVVDPSNLNLNPDKLNDTQYPPPIDTEESRDSGKFGIFSPYKEKASYSVDASTVDDLGLPNEGMVLGRVTVRSLMMRDWTPFFYIVMKNSDIRYYDDPNFIRKHFDDDYSIVIYREKNDYLNFPLGQRIKKVIPLKPNYCCGEVKSKEYSGYGDLYYFVIEARSEYKNVAIAKFASNNRNDIDVMWVVIKGRISDAKRNEISHLVGR